MENIEKSLYDQQQFLQRSSQFQQFKTNQLENQQQNQAYIPKQFDTPFQQQSQSKQTGVFQQHYFQQLIDINNDELLKTMLQDPISSQFVNDRLNELCQQKFHQIKMQNENQEQFQQNGQHYMQQSTAPQQNQQLSQLENFMNVLMIQNQSLQGKVEELQQSILFPTNQSAFQSNQSSGIKLEDYIQALKTSLLSLEQILKSDCNRQKIIIEMNKLKSNLNSLEQSVKQEKEQFMSSSQNYDFQNLRMKKKKKILQLKEMIRQLEEQNNAKNSESQSQKNNEFIIEQQAAEIERLQSIQKEQLLSHQEELQALNQTYEQHLQLNTYQYKNIQQEQIYENSFELQKQLNNKIKELQESYIIKDEINKLLKEKKMKWRKQKEQFQEKEMELIKELRQKQNEVENKDKVIFQLNSENVTLSTKLNLLEKKHSISKEKLQEKLEYNEKLNHNFSQQLQQYQQRSNENKNNSSEINNECYLRFQELLCKLQKKLNTFPQKITELNAKQLQDLEKKFIKLQGTLNKSSTKELKYKKIKHSKAGKENITQQSFSIPKKKELKKQNSLQKITLNDSQNMNKDIKILKSSQQLNNSFQYLPIRKEEAIPQNSSQQYQNQIRNIQNNSLTEIPTTVRQQVQFHPAQIVQQDNVQSVQKTTYYYPAFQQIQYKVAQQYHAQRGYLNQNYALQK